ncbi:MAG: hypothetical protein J3K34DRAFT_9150 [Monoraphidium minutum]|nr:MAG: hypothetical protein J3K34DRAFT_9150 [Monoraphidium minutum]
MGSFPEQPIQPHRLALQRIGSEISPKNDRWVCWRCHKAPGCPPLLWRGVPWVALHPTRSAPSRRFASLCMGGSASVVAHVLRLTIEHPERRLAWAMAWVTQLTDGQCVPNTEPAEFARAAPLHKTRLHPTCYITHIRPPTAVSPHRSMAKLLATLLVAMMVCATMAAPMNGEPRRGLVGAAPLGRHCVQQLRNPREPDQGSGGCGQLRLAHSARTRAGHCARTQALGSLVGGKGAHKRSAAPRPLLPRGAARRMLRGGGGGWDGGVQTQDIMSENDAIAGIEEAVSNDQFSSTYSAASNGYRDAYAATFPEDDAGQFWLNNAGQQTAGRHLL